MIPKRALGAAAITVFALALLLSFKTPGAASLAASNGADSAIVGQPADDRRRPHPRRHDREPARRATADRRRHDHGDRDAGRRPSGTTDRDRRLCRRHRDRRRRSRRGSATSRSRSRSPAAPSPT